MMALVIGGHKILRSCECVFIAESNQWCVSGASFKGRAKDERVFEKNNEMMIKQHLMTRGIWLSGWEMV